MVGFSRRAQVTKLFIRFQRRCFALYGKKTNHKRCICVPPAPRRRALEADNISRCISRWCYRRPARGGNAVNTLGPCLLERPFCPTASAAVVPRSAVIFRLRQTGVDGLASRTITIQHASVKADLNVCSFLSPLPPTFIFLCFPFNRPFSPSAVRFNVLAFSTMFCSPSLHLFLCLLSIVILILIIIIVSLP